MPCLSKMTCLATALLATTVLAVPNPGYHMHHRHQQQQQQRSTNCDYGIADPTDCPPGVSLTSVLSQWCGMVTTEITGLNNSEDPSTILPTIEGLYKQANIAASPSSAIASAEAIMQYPLARAAMTKMKAAYPLTGSPDLTEADILEVYAPAIKEACSRSGVPEEIIAMIIWTESKGHPLVYQGLTQMDYVAWGQMADENPDLKNRYQPWSNIIASAMFLAGKQKQYGGSWEDVYHAYYQG